MQLKKSYNLLYMPEDHGASRQFNISRWGLILPLGFLGVLVVVAVLYGAGITTGNSWLPGGSALQRENHVLKGTIKDLEGQVVVLREEINSVREIQNMMAAAIDLPMIDEETFSAGVGGRNHMDYADAEMPAFDLDESIPAEGLGDDLALMLRQARIQKQGYLAMLDTLSTRAVVRGKIPSIRPTDTGWMSSRFGFRKDPFTEKQTFHRGLDFSVPLGTPVRVTGDGVILAVQQQRGFGRVIKVDHGGGVVTVYAHLDQQLVKKGDKVSRGDVIGKSGSTGRSSAPHLHYEIRISNRPVNPLSYILDSYAARQ